MRRVRGPALHRPSWQSQRVGYNHGKAANLLLKAGLQIRLFSDRVDKPINDQQSLHKRDWLALWFGVESNVASPQNSPPRWTMLLPAFMNHLCIGSPYAWSLMADEITKEVGFVVPAADDWTLMQAELPLSLVFVCQGLAAAYFGKWQIKVGVRKSLATAALCFGGGMIVGAGGIYLHSLPLLYAGYGVLAGTGIGLAYTPPVQALMQCFPDKKGIASGLTIAGFGSGALLFTKCIKELSAMFSKLPTYLGHPKDYLTSTIEGKLYASYQGELVEVVKVNALELQKLSLDLPEGLYVVGTGSTGAAEALAVMGATYFAVMMLSALAIKTPPVGYQPPTLQDAPPEPAVPVQRPQRQLGDNNEVSTGNVYTVERAMISPQFHLLGITFLYVGTCGMGLFSVAKPMMTEIFSSALPSVVTSTFAANYLLALSGGNLGGRLGWSALSDAIGRKRVFDMITIGSIPLYLAMPSLVANAISSGDSLPLYAFCACSAVAISGMGGVYAMLPAYEADLFSSKYVGAIHGRMLLYSSAASLAGPYMLMYLRSISEYAAIKDIMASISDEDFLAAFGAPVEQASQLIATKSLTIDKLLAVAPPHILDPSPYLYDNTMYTLGGLMAVAVVTHQMVGMQWPKLLPARNAQEDHVTKIEMMAEEKEVTRNKVPEIAKKTFKHRKKA